MVNLFEKEPENLKNSGKHIRWTTENTISFLIEKVNLIGEKKLTNKKINIIVS